MSGDVDDVLTEEESNLTRTSVKKISKFFNNVSEKVSITTMVLILADHAMLMHDNKEDAVSHIGCLSEAAKRAVKLRFSDGDSGQNEE